MTGPELCPKCKGLHFKTSPCIARVTKSAAERKDVLVNGSNDDGAAGIVTPTGRVRLPLGHGSKTISAGTQALPADTIQEQSSASQIAEGLKEALEVVKGTTKPHAVHTIPVREARAMKDKTVTTATPEPEQVVQLRRPEPSKKRGVGRPKTITDMRSYKAMKQREYRAKIKAQKEMGK